MQDVASSDPITAFCIATNVPGHGSKTCRKDPLYSNSRKLSASGLHRNNVGARRETDAGEGADMGPDVQPPISRQHFEAPRGPLVTPARDDLLHYCRIPSSRIRINTEFPVTHHGTSSRSSSLTEVSVLLS